MNIATTIGDGTHLPLLIRALEKTKGDVLELGMGVYSTPYLHYQCMLSKRNLVSYENNEPWVNFFIKAKGYENEYHKIHHIKDYANAKIERPWDVVLIDHVPSNKRIIDILRLKDMAKYIIVHDTNGKWDRKFHYKEVWPEFKYGFTFDKEYPSASVVSNFINLKDFLK